MMDIALFGLLIDAVQQLGIPDGTQSGNGQHLGLATGCLLYTSKDLWKLMNISNDRFIRTTDDYHVESVQKIFRKMYENGDIYKGVYKGKYCKPCESFWTENQLVDGCCPDCGRPVVDAEEEAYFFRLSKYADRVQHLLEDTDFLQPRSRVNEMVNNFIKPGLEDLLSLIHI